MPVPCLVTSRSAPFIKQDGTYVLAGGFGGLGCSIAFLLAELGARHICFFSRSGAASKKAKETLALLGDRHVQASAYAVDVSDLKALGHAVHQLKDKHPSIRGVINCAMCDWSPGNG